MKQISSVDSTWRLIGAALALALLCMGGALAALRADAQSQVIKDDPAVAPDARESADDNLTFPTDI
jgi:hypothetical protein